MIPSTTQFEYDRRCICCERHIKHDAAQHKALIDAGRRERELSRFRPDATYKTNFGTLIPVRVIGEEWKNNLHAVRTRRIIAEVKSGDVWVCDPSRIQMVSTEAGK